MVISEDRWMAALYADEMQSVADYVQYSLKLRSAIKPHLVSLLEAGVSVVLDFPTNTLANRERMMSIITESGAKHRLHCLNVADEICKSRLRARNPAGSHDFSATNEQFDRITRYFVEPAANEGFQVIEYH